MDLITIFEHIQKIDPEAQLIHSKESLAEISFKPASLRNIISNGIYYVVSGEFNIGFDKSVILANSSFETDNSAIIVVDNPQLVHYKLCHMFVNKPPLTLHETAIIHKDAQLSKNITIGPYSVIGNCVIEDGCVLGSHVEIKDNVVIKKNTQIDSSSVIGAEGMAWIWDEKGNRVMQPQLGGVIIEENCKLGTDITVVRGSLSENTVIGAGTVIAHGTKIGHGSQIMENVHMANNVSIAGNAIIGSRSFLGSGCVVSSNISIPEKTIIGAGAVVTKNFKEQYLTLGGVPASILRRENYNTKPKGAPKPFK